MKYKDTKTGAIITSDSEVGGDWELIESSQSDEVEPENEVEPEKKKRTTKKKEDAE